MSRKIISGPELYPLQIQEGLSKEQKKDAFLKEINEFRYRVFITKTELTKQLIYKIYHFDEYFVYVHKEINDKFIQKFYPFLDGNNLKYDNLINICIMVKNAGDGFRDILTQNLPFMDRYTILDTGSTDNTVSIIKEVLAGKRGELYEEPFINFRDSRNRLLELAGEHCHFNVMLDDTYVLKGRIREFLDLARGDDVVDSYSLTVEDTDTMYTSNRVTKPSRKLKYINLVHEIIETNLNVSIPYEWGSIYDVKSEYMFERTKKRKQNDIDTLLKMLEDNPSDPRTYYYIADSYICMKDWKNALEWFQKRVSMAGYNAEVQDSLYYIAVIKDMYLGYSWNECLEDYLRCYNNDPTRSESLYFIGMHYKNCGMFNVAFLYLKKAYDLGMPFIQMSVRKDIYNFHIPKDLVSICYELKEYKLGEEAARKTLNWKDDTLTKNWLYIFYHINQSNLEREKTRIFDETTIAFVSPGGWNNWDGETLRTKGLGGSENFTIRYAEQLVKMGYKVLVFCKCKEQKEYMNVIYLPIEKYPEIIGIHKIDIAIINRYCEYIAVSCLNNIKTYYVMHDTCRQDDIIVLDKNLKNILLISQWQKQNFQKIYKEWSTRTQVISYGIDTNEYPQKQKQKYMFIYPSFPNRGLYQLLLMWPSILQKYPSATLHIFCDTQNEWCQNYWKQEMDEIDKLLEIHKNTVTNHGWVNGTTIREFWSRAHIWFYPCTFEETCCLTAWEAAASKTLVVSNHLAALRESIGGRGVVILGNARDKAWHNKALERMFEVLDNEAEHEYIDRNYEWVCTKNIPQVVSDFEQRFIK